MLYQPKSTSLPLLGGHGCNGVGLRFQDGPPNPKLEENADQLAIDLSELMAKLREELMRDVERKRQELWESQKTCKPDRIQWSNAELNTVAGIRSAPPLANWHA